nr:hypothetical protein [uncultured Albidiferax sp.]
MGCNAWNHSADCTCGWGGIFYEANSPMNALNWPTQTGSFINPNARCPVCSNPVFFYKSPNGGSVFFDALGPPWPKHPCTVSQSSADIPNSAYWQANELLNNLLFKRIPMRVLVGSDAKFNSWLLEKMLTYVKNSQLRPITALWIAALPPAAIGVADVDLEKVKLVQVTAMADNVVRYLDSRKRVRWQKICREVAQAILDRAAEKKSKSGNVINKISI